MVAAFEGVRVDKVGDAVHGHPATTFFSEFFVPVFRGHLLLAEIAGLILEVGAVQRHHLSVELALHLLLEGFEGVSVEEVSAFAGVGMEIQKEAQPAYHTAYLFSASRYSARALMAKGPGCLSGLGVR